MVFCSGRIAFTSLSYMPKGLREAETLLIFWSSWEDHTVILLWSRWVQWPLVAFPLRFLQTLLTLYINFYSCRQVSTNLVAHNNSSAYMQRLVVWNQGVRKVALPLKALGRIFLCLLELFWLFTFFGFHTLPLVLFSVSYKNSCHWGPIHEIQNELISRHST